MTAAAEAAVNGTIDTRPPSPSLGHTGRGEDHEQKPQWHPLPPPLVVWGMWIGAGTSSASSNGRGRAELIPSPSDLAPSCLVDACAL